MNVGIRSLEIQGFRSFSSAEYVDLGASSGLFLIGGRNEVEPLVGANGSGKSSLWAALCWALFDKHPAGLRSSSLVTWDSDEKPGCSVTVTLVIDDQEFVVVRTWRPNGLILDGHPVTQDILENQLRCTFDQFLRSVYMAQGSRSFLDYPSAYRAGFISDLLGLDVWEDARDAAVKAIKHHDKSSDELQRDIAYASGTIEALESSSKQELIDRFEESRKKTVQQLQEDVASIRKVVADLDHRSKDVKLSENKLNRLSSAVSKADSEHRDALVQERGVKERIGEVDSMVASLSNADLAQCPTCGTDLKNDKRLDLLADATAMRDELWEKRRKIAEHASNTNSALTGAMKALETESAKHREVQLARERLKDAGRSLMAATDRVRIEQQKVNPYVAEEHGRKRNLGKAYVQRFRLRQRMEEQEQQAARAQFWKKGFAQIRLDLVGEVMKRMENECATNLTDLGLPDWHIEFSLDKENKSGTINRGFHVLVHSPHNSEPVPFESWSGGEAQRLRLAVSMGLADMVQDFNGAKWQFEVWDEPAAWLSQDGIDMLISALQHRARRLGKTVWLADHRALSAGAFDGVLTVVKDEHGSTTEWEK